MAMELIYSFQKSAHLFPEERGLSSEIDYVTIYLENGKALDFDKKINLLSEFIFLLKENNQVVLDYYYANYYSKREIIKFLEKKGLPYKNYYKRNILYFFKKHILISFKINKREDLFEFIRTFAPNEDNLFIRIIENNSQYEFPDFLKNSEKNYIMNIDKSKIVIFLSVKPIDFELVGKLDLDFVHDLITNVSNKFDLSVKELKDNA